MAIIAKDYWNQRYSSGGNSGYGSYDEQLTKKLKWLSGLDINSITEMGCGDFNFGSNLMKQYPKASYIGLDIADRIIMVNQSLYPQYEFKSEGFVPPADLLLCIDVLYHILDDTVYEEMLELLKNKWTKYLAITAYENEQITAPHLKIRKFDPTRFGTPILKEVVEKDGTLYFYIFKR